MGKIEGASKEENMVIIKTTSVTLIAMYITPGTPVENIIETISKATEETRKEKKVILAGDFNCRIDKYNTKTDILRETLEEEGFRLVNKKEVPTYIAPNGTSTIDLVFYRGDKLKLNKQEGLWTSTAAPIRKHILIITNFSIETTNNRKNKHRKQTFQKPRPRNIETRCRRNREG
jgi:hypothetical protein